MSDTLISAENVSKKYCRDLKGSLWYGIKDLGNELLGRRHGTDGQLRSREFWAVRNIDVQIKRGECLGLIGRNGAGKTTLLRMLNGLIKPDTGRIEVRGKVGALIALGAGFNPILSGRENVFINGSLLGLTRKEIEGKLDSIIDFADIGDFIDSPVQNYSSGMQVRLGFAVATALDPDILLLDEVLAVGDAAFRNRCYNRIGKLKKTSAVIFVSHSMDQVSQFCDRTLVLSSGQSIFDGDVSEGISRYESLQDNRCSQKDSAFETLLHPVTATAISISPSRVSYGEQIHFDMEIKSELPVSKTILKIVFYDETHRPCAEWNSDRLGLSPSLRRGTNRYQADLGPIILKAGKYRLGVVLNDEHRISMLVWSFKKHEITVDGFTSLGPPVALRSALHQSPEI